MSLFYNIRNIPTEFRADLVSIDEVETLLRQKVGEKYPNGMVKRKFSAVKQGGNILVCASRNYPIIGSAVSCLLGIGPKNGKFRFCIDGAIAQSSPLLTLCNIRKRSAFVEEVAGWVMQFLQSKQDQSRLP